MTDRELPLHLSRPQQGRWVGGVCAGLAARWGAPVRRVRGLFALTTPVFGLGAIAYVAFWLILPAEGEAGGPPGPRAAVVIAKACAALLALAALAIAGGAATVFGLGWVVVGLGAAVLAGVLATWPRRGPAWALLPVGAVVLPSVALAAGGLHIDPSTKNVTVAPRTVAELPDGGVRSGLGELTVDLRRTELPDTGTVRLRIAAGVRPTVVALPHDRCVRVIVHRREAPLALRAGSVLMGAGDARPSVRVFGDSGRERSAGSRPGPTLRLDFSSMGGDLTVRDYPDGVNPQRRPDWPDFGMGIEYRPRHAPPRALRAWRHRRDAIEAANQRVRRETPGPCARSPR